LAVLNAVRQNKHITSCDVELQENAKDIRMLKILQKAIRFLVEDNDIIKDLHTARRATFFSHDNLHSDLIFADDKPQIPEVKNEKFS